MLGFIRVWYFLASHISMSVLIVFQQKLLNLKWAQANRVMPVSSDVFSIERTERPHLAPLN